MLIALKFLGAVPAAQVPELIERAALRDMVVLEDEERRAKLQEMFALEQKRFAEQLPKLKRLPHLIMFE